MLKEPRTKTHDLLNALRNWHPDHDALVAFFAVLASSLKHNETGLTENCRAVVVDYCDEAFGQIENDRVAQQSEQAWDDRKPLNKYFEPVLEQLDALTFRSKT